MGLIRWLCHLPRRLAIRLVKGYQRLFSPDHSFWSKSLFPHGYCKYTPSCSEYSRLSFEKNGFVRGILKSLWRILRCNPWSKGGIDLP
ncbi:membrane protein insertion efficiency factor YidD [Candidatus Peregrinibacteria bacterium]|nr:membrane protein insertion efficiency factor YidD [Candidatus Peregrinibacteria bacterium]